MHCLLTGVQALDLSNTLVDDVDIIRVLQQLPNLRILNLGGCRKLTSIGLDVIESVAGKQQKPFKQLQVKGLFCLASIVKTHAFSRTLVVCAAHCRLATRVPVPSEMFPSKRRGSGRVARCSQHFKAGSTLHCCEPLTATAMVSKPGFTDAISI